MVSQLEQAFVVVQFVLQLVGLELLPPKPLQLPRASSTFSRTSVLLKLLMLAVASKTPWQTQRSRMRLVKLVQAQQALLAATSLVARLLARLARHCAAATLLRVLFLVPSTPGSIKQLALLRML